MLSFSLSCYNFCQAVLPASDKGFTERLLSFARENLKPLSEIGNVEDFVSNFFHYFGSQEPLEIWTPFITIQNICYGMNIDVEVFRRLREKGHFDKIRPYDVLENYWPGYLEFGDYKKMKTFFKEKKSIPPELQVQMNESHPIFVKSIVLFFFLLPYFCTDEHKRGSDKWPRYLATVQAVYLHLESLSDKFSEEYELIGQMRECSELAWAVISRSAEESSAGGLVVSRLSRSAPIPVPGSSAPRVGSVASAAAASISEGTSRDNTPPGSLPGSSSRGSSRDLAAADSELRQGTSLGSIIGRLFPRNPAAPSRGNTPP